MYTREGAGLGNRSIKVSHKIVLAVLMGDAVTLARKGVGAILRMNLLRCKTLSHQQKGETTFVCKGIQPSVSRLLLEVSQNCT